MPTHDPLRFVTAADAVVEPSPWGPHEWLSRAGLTAAERLMLVRVTMPRGKGHAFHRHPAMEEIIYVVSGRAEQWVDREARVLGPGEVAHIPADVVHGTYNAGEGDLVFLAILSPAVFDASPPRLLAKHPLELLPQESVNVQVRVMITLQGSALFTLSTPVTVIGASQLSVAVRVPGGGTRFMHS